MNLAQLKELDALFLKNAYSDEIFLGMLPYVTTYLNSLPRLRSLQLGEVQAAFVMLPGGKR